MFTPHRIFRFATLLGFLFAATFADAADAPSAETYAAQLATARALAAEGSHTLARDAFAAAQSFAPDAAQRRWSELWALEQSYAALPPHASDAGLDQKLHTLLTPYEREGRPRDEFWGAGLRLIRNFPNRVDLQLQVAGFWATQPVSPAGADSFVASLVTLAGTLAKYRQGNSPPTADALELLRRALDNPALAAHSARPALALRYARALEQHRPDLKLTRDSISPAYEHAVAATRGTPLAGEALLFHADWSLRSGKFATGQWPDHDLRPTSPVSLTDADFRSAFALLDTALAATPAQAPDQNIAQVVTFLRQRKNDLSAAHLVLDTSEAYLPDARFSFGLTAQHVSTLELKLFRVTFDELPDVAFGNRRAGDLPSAIVNGSPLHTWTLPTGIDGPHGRQVSRHAWREPLAPGAYVLVARDPTGRFAGPVMRWFLVTKLQAFAQRVGAGPLDVCVFDPATGTLPASIRGDVIANSGARERLTTREPGRATATLRAFRQQWESARIFGEADGHPFVLPHVDVNSAAAPTWRLHLLADRPLYQPGETARWKLTARQLDRGELRVPAGQRLKIVAVSGNDRDELASWNVSLDELGSASGQLVIPARTAPGQVAFDVGLPDDEDAFGVIDAFRVDHFRAPEASLTLEPLDAAQLRLARAGGYLELKATARYFSGEPLPGATISASVRFTRRTHFYHSFQSDGPAHDNFPSELLLQATTDAHGEARLRVLLPPQLPLHTGVRLDARLTATGLSANSHFAFDLLPAGYAAELAPDSQSDPQISPGSQFAPPVVASAVHALPYRATPLALFARDGRNNPAAVRGEIAIVRQTWEEIWRTPEGALLTGDTLRQRQRAHFVWPPRELGWERIHSSYRKENVATFPVATDASGRTSFACPPLPAGYYELRYEPDTPIPGHAEPLAKLELFVADATTSWLAISLKQPLLVPTAPIPGQPIRFLAILPAEGRRALVSIAGLAGGESRLEDFSGNVRLLEFPWQPGYWAGAKLALVPLSPEDPTSAHAALTPARTAHTAHVHITPAETKSRPGTKTKLILRTTDAADRPIASHVALSVADASVASLLPEKRKSARETFLAPEAIRSPHPVFTARPVDSRILTTTQPGGPGELDTDTIMLSPFQVSSERESGYAASMTLAGSRTDIRVVTKQSLADASDEPRVRGTFSYTAFWAPDVKTNARGEAVVEFEYPDNLTQWQIAAEAISARNRFGAGQSTTQTTLPFQARLRLPRSVVLGDTVGLLGTVINATPDPKTARVEFISPENGLLLGRSLDVPSLGEATVTGDFRPAQLGDATLRLNAVADSASDAMELKLPVREDGFVQRTGVTAHATDRPVTVTLALPEPLDLSRTAVELQVSPGFIPAMIDALPYLVDYPYGCVEQTMSRFLPAAIVARLLHDLKIDPVAVERRILSTARTAPRTAGLAKLDDVVAQSISRLEAAQNSDGSFGWFAQGMSDPYMTAYVLRGLNIAKAAGIAVPEHLHARAHDATLGFMEDRTRSSLAPQQTAWILSALTTAPAPFDDNTRRTLTRAFADLYAVRADLTPSGVALLSQSAAALQQRDEIAVLRRNLEDGVVRARSTEFGETAHWGQTAGYFDGLHGAVETTALCLQALLAIDPQHPLVDAAATWLLVNRQSGRWSNTRDTALSILALHDYARARGATTAKGSFRLTVNDRVVAERRFDRESLLTPLTFAVDPALLRGGDNRIALSRLDGSAPCFLIATAKRWAQSETTKPAGSMLSVARDYARIADRPSLIGFAVPRTDSLPSTGASVDRNDRVECRLVVEAKQDLEYIAIEVPKPGGCEPVNPLSGWDATLRRIGEDETNSSAKRSAAHGERLYREEHPDGSVFFLPRISAGRWEIRYTMRATFTGDYRALPATVEAMYVPVIAGNSDARRLRIHSVEAK